ncbi:MAG TPA: hypothetical protein VFM16_05570 [Holophagaceae bacterium]|nr:hypothetical protein [Holophagaceae bacterium]
MRPRRPSFTIFPALLLAAAPLVSAPAVQAPPASVPDRIASAYVFTKPTADMTDIVKQGDVLVLKKDDLFMCSIVSAIPSVNTYKRGKISQSFFNKMKFFTASGSAPTVPTRTFVAGEKVLLTGVEMKEDGVQLSLLSPVMDGKRYKAFLVLPFSKGNPPAADQVLQTLAEVVSVEPASQEKPAAPAARTIAIGQTRDQVQAVLGQPTTVVQLGGGREIEHFPTMKVTFLHGRVVDVQ